MVLVTKDSWTEAVVPDRRDVGKRDGAGEGWGSHTCGRESRTRLEQSVDMDVLAASGFAKVLSGAGEEGSGTAH